MNLLNKQPVCRTIFLIIAFVSGCSITSESTHHQKSKNLASFNYQQTPPFSSYILHTRSQISQNRVFIDSENRQAELEMNAPFEWPTKKQCPHSPTKGILLVHGLFETPFEFKDLARVFHERCFLVRAVILPGHGTRPADLIDINYQDWVETVDYGIRSLQSEVDEVYIAGFSLGGLLAANTLLDNSGIKAAVLIAPAIGLRAPALIWNTQWLRYIKDWVVKRPYGMPVRYISIATNAPAQTYSLSQNFNRKLEVRKKFPAPVLLIVSIEDIAIQSETALKSFSDFAKHDKSRALVFSMSKQLYDDPRIHYLNSYLPAQRIFSLSHSGLPYSPGNPVFGVNGMYRAYSYDKTPQQWAEDRENNEHYWRGELSYEQDREPMQRLTHNPLFGEMVAEIDKFFDQLSE
jgi:esterase/lipase